MAVLSDTGAHCSIPECRQRDFLPFTCDQCSQVFCLDHFRYASHGCPSAGGRDNRVLVCPLCEKGVRLVPEEDPNLTWDRHVREGCVPTARAQGAAKKAKCPVPGCKELLTSSGSVCCGRCGLRTCLRHRFEEDHSCAALAATASLEQAAPRPAGRRPPSTRPSAPSSSAPGPSWPCPRCTLANDGRAAECVACGAARPAPAAPWQAAVQAAQAALGQGGGRTWRCGRCTLENAAGEAVCAACGAAPPAGSGSAAEGGGPGCVTS